MAGIDQFFGALNAVAGDPGSTPLRQQVLTSAALMAERFNGLNNVFNAQLQSVRTQRGAIVDSANAQIATIARLNGQISAAQAGGLSASAMIDARGRAPNGALFCWRRGNTRAATFARARRAVLRP